MRPFHRRSFLRESNRGFDAAKDERDGGDIQKVAWFSTVQGKPGEGRDLSLAPAGLDLGLHGFYAKVWGEEGDRALSDTLWIPVQTAIGRAVLVAGTAFDEYRYFFENIALNLNFVYQRLRCRGFTDEQIHYMNPVGWQSLQDPYQNSGVVDETKVTREKPRAHIQGLRKDAQNHVPILLVFLGHGYAGAQNGIFYLSPGEYLTPDTLGARLDELGDLDEKQSQITVVLGFCYSGSFQPELRMALHQGRMIVTSTDADHAAYFVRGKIISWTLFDQVHKSRSMGEAFAAAREWSASNALGGSAKANPQLSANNNLKANENEDFSLAEGLYVGGSQQLQGITPEIRALSDSVEATGQGKVLNLWATVSGDVEKLWYRLLDPGGTTSGAGPETWPTQVFTKVNDTTWRAVHPSQPISAGRHALLVEGSTSAGPGPLSKVWEVEFPQGLGIAKGSIPVLRHGVIRIGRYIPSLGITIEFFQADGPKQALRILDIRGHDLRRFSPSAGPGWNKVVWDGNDFSGREVSAGLYQAVLFSGDVPVEGKTLYLP